MSSGTIAGEAPLSELEHDAILELLNIGVGQSAQMLSQMVSEEVLLSVPSLLMLAPRDALAYFKGASNGVMTAVSQEFQGDFGGRALLVFPHQDSLNLVRRLLREDIPLELLTDLEQEALSEVGNIVLNGCLGAIANALSLTVSAGLPQLYQRCADSTLMLSLAQSEVVLLINIRFQLPVAEISGYLSFVMDVGNLQRFREHLGRYLAQFGG